MKLISLLVLCLSIVSSVWSQVKYEHAIGTGIYDITGPAAQVNMMGYAKANQITSGIHTRLFSRSYVFVDQNSGKRVVVVCADIGQTTELIKMRVLKQLKEIYGNLYNDRNVAIASTHTHSGPGGYHQYILFDITSLGYVEQSTNAIVDGIVQSIILAHDNIQPARGFMNVGNLIGAGINRSPYSYEQNPKEERDFYGSDTDTTMTVVKLINEKGEEMGMMNWFPTHPVSMNNTNKLISGDNKGVASYLFEKLKNGQETLPGKGPFIASHFISNAGDITPNTKGAFCTGGRRPGLKCDYVTSTCPTLVGFPSSGLCNGQGPAGKDDKENTRIIGTLQYEKGRELYDSATQPITGSIDFRQAYVDMSTLTFSENGKETKLCKAAMGYSFAAGTTDGPGFFLFDQGELEGTPFFDAVRDFIKEPSQELIDCQKPKPILFPTGEMRFPYDWQASIVDIQLFKIGNLVILFVPGEITTMGGRRLMKEVKQILIDEGVISKDGQVVISAMSNVYADYITTFEEYQVQRYEGGSTIYGPNTLNGFIHEFKRLTFALANGTEVPQGPFPPDFSRRLISLLPDPKPDFLPDGSKFGQVVTDVQSRYSRGETVQATFWGANPRHNLQTGGSFLYVERRSTQGNWVRILSDGDWETEFKWEKVSELSDDFMSMVTLIWNTSLETNSGEYRLMYSGHSLDTSGKVTPFSGYSSVFTLV